MPHLRCSTCYERIEAPYEEALTIALGSHLEMAHGREVSLAELAPIVKGTMSGGSGSSSIAAQLWVARIAAILVALFFVLVALELGPGWLAISVLAGVLVVLINVAEANQA